MRTIFVIPTYNEADNIEQLLCDILKHTSSEILVVDDNSPDGTADIVFQLNNWRINLIRRTNKSGLGSAYREGFVWALTNGYDKIGQMDADFSHDPTSIPEMAKMIQDCTLVIGSRYIEGGWIKGWGLWRRFCSRSAIIFSKIILRIPVQDITSGFRLWDAKLLRKILNKNIQSNGYAFQEEMLYRAHKHGANIVELPIRFVDRVEGRSKLGWKDVFEFFVVIVRLRLKE